MNRNRYTDWQEPLYEYAKQQMEKETVSALKEARDTFSFLGAYRDSAALRSRCTEKLRQLEEERSAERGDARGQMHSAVRKAKGRPAVRKTFRVCLAAGICSAALAAAVFLGWQKHVLNQARMYEKSGAYDASLENYWKLLIGPFSREAAEKIPELQRAYGYSLLANRQFQQAVDLFEELEDSDGVKEAHNAWGEFLAEEGSYAEAVDQFEQAENDRKKQETYLDWSDAEAANGKIQEAIDILLQAETSDKSRERLTDLRKRRCEEAVRSLRSGTESADPAAGSEEVSGSHTERDVKRAAKIGADLDDADSLLIYCRALAECGYEPGEVYPDGVEVIDVPTGTYQLPDEKEPVSAEQNQTVPAEGKGLFFTREQMVLDNPKQYLHTHVDYSFSPPWDPADDSLYRLKLQVAELYQLPEEKRAESLQDCSWIYLADTVYHVSGIAGMVNEFLTRMNGRTVTMKTMYDYPFLAAVDSGAFYAWEEQGRCEVIGYQMTVPELQIQLTGSDAVHVTAIPVPCDPLELTEEEMTEMFFGKPDAEFRKNMLKKGVDTVIAG